jgi:hypothetical protein
MKRCVWSLLCCIMFYSRISTPSIIKQLSPSGSSLQPSRTRSVASLEPPAPPVSARAFAKSCRCALAFPWPCRIFCVYQSPNLCPFLLMMCVFFKPREQFAPFTLPLTLLHSNTHTRVALLQQGHAGDHLPNKTQRRSQCSLAARGRQTDGLPWTAV